MKTRHLQIGILLLSLAAVGCSTAYYRAESGYAADDLYGTHNQIAIAERRKAEAEAKRAEAEAIRAEWEARIAQASADGAQADYYGNSYQGVLADTYESAYARRLRGFESPGYNMPSSYEYLRYSSKFQYLSAYDPAYYNIIVMGDEAWVEPKYITAMFGTWGAPTVTTIGFSGGLYNSWYMSWGYNPYWWNRPSWSFGFGFGPSYYDPWWGWNNPWGPGWGYPGWGYPGWGYPGWGYPGWWGPGWGPGGGGGHHNPNVIWQGAYHRPGGDYIGNRRPGTGSTSFNQGAVGSSSFRYDRNGNSTRRPVGNSVERNNGNRGSSTYRNNSSTYRNNSSNQNRINQSTYRRNESTNSFNRSNFDQNNSSLRNNTPSSSFNRGTTSGSFGGSSGGSTGGSSGGGRNSFGR